MPSITLSAGQVSDPIEVGPGTRVTAVGGYVQWTTGSMVDARNGVATWQNWPAGAVAATEDTLRRVVIRAVATGAMTLTWDESRQDEGADGVYWQEQIPAWATDPSGLTGLVLPNGRVSVQPLDLKAFGAVGDGVTNDTAAIQLWAAAMQRAVVQGSGAAGYVPPGVYRFVGTVAFPACVIEGAGAHTSVFLAGSSGSGITIEAPAGVDTSQGATAAYSNFTIDGNGVVTGTLVRLGVFNYPTFIGVAIRNTVGTGLALYGTQNGSFINCAIMQHGEASVLFGDGTFLGQPLGAAGNGFLKCEVGTYGKYAVDSTQRAFNNCFEECGIEYSTATTLAAIRLTNIDNQANSLIFRGGFVTVQHAIPVFDLKQGTLCFDGGQAYGGTVSPALFNLDGSGVLLKTDGSCTFSGATHLFYARNTGAFVYDLGNYFNACTNDFGTNVGAVQDNVVQRPFYSRILARRGQIKFPTTQVPTTDPNTLDDYAEGTFSPAIQSNGAATGITMVTASGSFTKVGRLVFVTINATANISGPSAGSVTIAGLPFTSGGATPGALSVGSFFGLPSGTVMSAQVQASPSTTISLFTQNNGTAQVGNRAMTNADLGANVGFMLSGCYTAQN